MAFNIPGLERLAVRQLEYNEQPINRSAADNLAVALSAGYLTMGSVELEREILEQSRSGGRIVLNWGVNLIIGQQE